MQIVKRLAGPYKSNCTHNEELFNVFPPPSTRLKCKYTLIFKHMLANCGEVPDDWNSFVKAQHEKGWNYQNRSRSEEAVAECIKSHYQMHDDVDYSVCPLPCSETSFEGNIVRLDGESNPTEVRLYVNYQSRRVTEITEVPVYTSDNFFSDLGSWLGLLVGMSFLSIVELITFISTIVVEKLF